jgi:putative tryptophan/tyrosine transport system substrate-binding protein
VKQFWIFDFRFWIGCSKRRIGFFTLAALLFALCTSTAAQQPRIPKIGWLALRPTSSVAGIEVFRREISKLGYIEGQNIVIEYRSADNRIDRLPALAEELIHLKVDVLVTPAINETLAAKTITKTIPIVFAGVPDPVGSAVVQSLAKPGGNVSGFSNISSILVGKRLELLKETVPKVARVAILWNPKTQGAEQLLNESQAAARALSLQLHSMEVSSADKYESAFKETIKSGATAIAVQSIITGTQRRVAELAAKNRLPAIYPRENYVDSGGLMSYGADRVEPYNRAAVYVDKILKGAKPADLPVEQPSKFELIINLKAAEQIGLTIPPNVLARADRVIK